MIHNRYCILCYSKNKSNQPKLILLAFDSLNQQFQRKTTYKYISAILQSLDNSETLLFLSQLFSQFKPFVYPCFASFFWAIIIIDFTKLLYPSQQCSISEMTARNNNAINFSFKKFKDFAFELYNSMGNKIKAAEQKYRMHHQRLGVLHLKDWMNGQSLESGVILICEIDNEQQYKNWRSNLSKLTNNQNRQILYLPIRQRFLEKCLCGSAGVIEIELEYYHHTLKQQITIRHMKDNYFHETELWYMLYSLIVADLIFENVEQKLANFHPYNILINQNGRVKVIPNSLIPKTLSSYDQIIEDITADVFLAPEQINQRDLAQGIYPANIDKKKVETFEIGLTIVMAATLQDCYNVYERKPFKLNKNNLHKLLKQIESTYGFYFYETIKSLVIQNPKKRKHLSQIFIQLNEFQESILSFRSFYSDDQSRYLRTSKSRQLDGSIHSYLSKSQLSQIHIYKSLINSRMTNR